MEKLYDNNGVLNYNKEGEYAFIKNEYLINEMLEPMIFSKGSIPDPSRSMRVVIYPHIMLDRNNKNIGVGQLTLDRYCNEKTTHGCKPYRLKNKKVASSSSFKILSTFEVVNQNLISTKEKRFLSSAHSTDDIKIVFTGIEYRLVIASEKSKANSIFNKKFKLEQKLK